MIDSKPLIALVTGATGAIGPTLVKNLIKEGFQVRVLLQPGVEAQMLPEDVTYIIGDITDQDSVIQAVNGVDCVFHLAAKLHINNPDPSLEKEYERVNVEGTKKIVDASVAANVSRVIFFNTINVYGSGRPGQEFFENNPLDPQSLYAMTKAKAEQIVINARSTSDGKPLGVILRLAAVYGPGMKGNYISLIKGLKQGWFIPIGSGKNRRTLIFVDDAVRAAVLAARHPESAGNIYNLTDGRNYTLQDIINSICKALHRKTPRIYLPAKLIRFGLGLVEDIFKLIGKRSPVGRQTIDAMLEDRAVNGDKIQQDLGYKPKIELDQGWSRVVEGVYQQPE